MSDKEQYPDSFESARKVSAGEPLQSNRSWTIKWYDARILPLTIALGIFAWIVLYGLAMRIAPAPGHKFERLTPLRGIYKCCEAGGRYSRSFVDRTGVFCLAASYYQVSTGRDDCGLKDELSGREVVVERVLVPTVWGPAPIVVQIESSARIYFEVSDKRLRERWLRQSILDSLVLAWIFTVIFHGSRLIAANHFDQRRKGVHK